MPLRNASKYHHPALAYNIQSSPDHHYFHTYIIQTAHIANIASETRSHRSSNVSAKGICFLDYIADEFVPSPSTSAPRQISSSSTSGPRPSPSSSTTLSQSHHFDPNVHPQKSTPHISNPFGGHRSSLLSPTSASPPHACMRFLIALTIYSTNNNKLIIQSTLYPFTKAQAVPMIRSERGDEWRIALPCLTILILILDRFWKSERAISKSMLRIDFW